MTQLVAALLLAAGGPFKGSAPLNFPTVSSGQPALSLAQGASVNLDVNGVCYMAETPAGTMVLDGGLSVTGAASITGATTITGTLTSGALSAASSTLTGASGCYTMANGCSYCPESHGGVLISAPADGGLGNDGQFTLQNFYQANFDSTNVYGGITLNALGVPTITVSNPVEDGGTTYCFVVTVHSFNGENTGSAQVCDIHGWNNLGAEPETVSWSGVAHAQTYTTYLVSQNSDGGYGTGFICDFMPATSCTYNGVIPAGGGAPPATSNNSALWNVKEISFTDGGSGQPYLAWNPVDNSWFLQNVNGGFEFGDGTAGHYVGAFPSATPYIALGSGQIQELAGKLGVNQPINVTGGVATTLHMLSQGSHPTVGSFAGCFGSGPSGGTTTGGEFAGILNITNGSGTSNCTAGTALFVVTLPTGYASSSYVVLIQTGDAPPAPNAGVSFAGVPTSATTFTVYNIGAFTPTASATRHWQYITAGAGVAN